MKNGLFKITNKVSDMTLDIQFNSIQIVRTYGHQFWVQESKKTISNVSVYLDVALDCLDIKTTMFCRSR